jgi:hypothetical protein
LPSALVVHVQQPPSGVLVHSRWGVGSTSCARALPPAKNKLANITMAPMVVRFIATLLVFPAAARPWDEAHSPVFPNRAEPPSGDKFLAFRYGPPSRSVRSERGSADGAGSSVSRRPARPTVELLPDGRCRHDASAVESARTQDAPDSRVFDDLSPGLRRREPSTQRPAGTARKPFPSGQKVVSKPVIARDGASDGE